MGTIGSFWGDHHATGWLAWDLGLGNWELRLGTWDYGIGNWNYGLGIMGLAMEHLWGSVTFGVISTSVIIKGMVRTP